MRVVRKKNYRPWAERLFFDVFGSNLNLKQAPLGSFRNVTSSGLAKTGRCYYTCLIGYFTSAGNKSKQKQMKSKQCRYFAAFCNVPV